MANIARRFIAISIVYLILGMAHGIHMGMSGDHSQFPLHAHVNLVGWTSLALYGLTYRAFPGMEKGRLAAAHFWLANAGALLMAIGLYVLLSYGQEAIVIAGSFLTIAGGIAFFINFIRRSAQTA